MKAYRFLTADTTSAFCHKVTEALSKGWELYGDPVMTFDAAKGEVVCGQAVTKDVVASYDPGMKLGQL